MKALVECRYDVVEPPRTNASRKREPPPATLQCLAAGREGLDGLEGVDAHACNGDVTDLLLAIGKLDLLGRLDG